MNASPCRRWLVCFVVWSGLLLTPALSSAQAKALLWPQFRGPDGLGVSKDKVPLTWSQEENILWKTALPSAGSSTPIIVGDKIYLTCYTGFGVPGKPKGNPAQLQRLLVCLDRGNGKIIWNTSMKAKQLEPDNSRDKHGYASNSVAADNERLYVFFGASGVYAFDYDGKELWHADVGDRVNGWGSAASPILYEDLVIVNASVESSALVALEKTNGKEKWRAGGIQESWNTPILVTVPGKGTELAVAIMGKVLGYDPATGKNLWSCKTDIPWYMVPCLVAHDGIIYCTGGRNNGGTLAVRAGGSGDVTGTHRLWSANKGTNVPSPIYHDGYLYWFHDNLGIAYCTDVKTGELVYEQRVGGANQFYPSPVLAGGKIYALDRSGKTFVLPAQPKFEILAVNNLKDGSDFFASPSVADGKLFLRSDRYLYCIGEKQ